MNSIIKELILKINILRLYLYALRGIKRTLPAYKVLGVVLHHEGGSNGFERVNLWHKKKWGFESSLGYYIGYNRYVDSDGTIHIARLDGEQAAHTVVAGKPYYYNRHYIGICFQGNNSPTTIQFNKVKAQLDLLRAQYPGLDIKAHSELHATICPGDKIREWLKEYKKGLK